MTRSIRICRNSTRTSVSISSQSKKSRFQGAFCIRMRLSTKNLYNFTSFVTPQQPPTPQPCTSVNPSLKDSSGANSSWPKPELPLSKPFGLDKKSSESLENLRRQSRGEDPKRSPSRKMEPRSHRLQPV